MSGDEEPVTGGLTFSPVCPQAVAVMNSLERWGRWWSRLSLVTGLGIFLGASGAARGDIGYQFVTVGNPGNSPDPATGSQYGGVSYTYEIGTYDVTLNQYCTFLNAVAKSDPYGLYNGSLATDALIEGITRSGASGNYSYSVIGNSGQDPATFVSWLDSARMANWMQNGQPFGLGEVAASTEQGAYTLNGDTTGGLEARNANAAYFIPTENEWYKAAYYDPTLNGGAGGYWTYATRSNTTPGNQIGSAPDQANYYTTVYSVTQQSAQVGGQNYLTPVGSFTGSASYYGTYDQSGDVYDMTDTILGSAGNRVLRGGSFYGGGATVLSSSFQDNGTPTFEGGGRGFRLAGVLGVPEPSVATGLVLGVGLLLAKRRNRSPASRGGS